MCVRVRAYTTIPFSSVALEIFSVLDSYNSKLVAWMLKCVASWGADRYLWFAWLLGVMNLVIPASVFSGLPTFSVCYTDSTANRQSLHRYEKMTLLVSHCGNGHCSNSRSLWKINKKQNIIDIHLSLGIYNPNVLTSATASVVSWWARTPKKLLLIIPDADLNDWKSVRMETRLSMEVGSDVNTGQLAGFIRSWRIGGW